MTHLHLDLLQAGVQLSERGGGGSGGGSDIEKELCVVGIEIQLYPMPADNTTEWKDVKSEKGLDQAKSPEGPHWGGI